MTSHFAPFYILRGIRLLFQPGIKRFVIIPLCLNILLFSLLLWLTNHYYHALSAIILHYLPHWLAWLTWVVGIVFFLGFFLLFLYAFTTLSNLISAPFNSLLAEQVELLVTGQKPPNRSLKENLHDLPRVVGRQLKMLAYYIPRVLIILILSFIPVVQFVDVGLWFLFNAWFMTVQYLDYPADNHRVSLKDMFMKMKKNRTSSLGFGLGVLTLSMVPFLNFIVMPAAVAGGTLFWIEQIKYK